MEKFVKYVKSHYPKTNPDPSEEEMEVDPFFKLLKINERR